MNLVNGKIIDKSEVESVIETLESRIIHTLSKPTLNPDVVINACDRLVKNASIDKYMPIFFELGVTRKTLEYYLSEARKMFCADSLRLRMETELGVLRRDYTPIFGNSRVIEQIKPLGVLLHIAAGNVDGLPVFSVLEGLLTGNINIMKLPVEEGGISVLLLKEMFEFAPELAEYVYVFDYSSKDIETMRQMINLADGVAVWGGDTAVSSLRKLVPPNIKLIEWGHKMSFAYITPNGYTDSDLLELAKHINLTDGLLCSSCQGVFIDTKNKADLYAFCERFLPILDKATANKTLGIGTQAQITIKLQNERLENKNRVYKAKNCSIIVCEDSVLTTGFQFGNIWVKPLPRNSIIEALRQYKNYLQTVGLICTNEERSEISEMLFAAGAVRVTQAGGMSKTYCGSAHDGEYPLRRYTKIVSVE